MPRFTALRIFAVVVAIFVTGILIAAQISVPYRATRPPEGYDQSRLHWNTKNATRFVGADAGEVARRVSRAVYPATDNASRPDVAILYAVDDWQGGLAAASLLRPLNAVLLPAVPGIEAEIGRLGPRGSAALDGIQVVRLNGMDVDVEGLSTRDLATADIPTILQETGISPRHAIVVDPEEPATALLAAPWAAFSGDLILFDPADVPRGIPTYTLGDVRVEGARQIAARSPAMTAVAFARYEDPENPLFGWGMSSDSPTGYRAYTLALPDDPATALQSANLARRGKPGPLLWSEERRLPQVVNNYLWSQRPAFWITPSEGPFHHIWILGDPDAISFPAASQADYAIEIGPYRMKGVGAASMDMLAAAWIVLGLASALWIATHETRFLPHQNWVMRLAWPMLALVMGPFGIPFYLLVYRRPAIRGKSMMLWDRPLWLQGLAATASSVGFGGPLMVVTGYLLTLLGLPLFPSEGPFFWLAAPMVLVMIADYAVAVLISWLVFQTPMLAMFYGRSYGRTLGWSLVVVVISMASVSLAMFPGMWWLMMWNLPMMPSEESILWFGVMYFTVFLGFLVSWPLNYLFIRRQVKSGLM